MMRRECVWCGEVFPEITMFYPTCSFDCQRALRQEASYEAWQAAEEEAVVTQDELNREMYGDWR